MHRRLPPPADDVLDGVRLLREVRPADLARRGRARQGLAAAQDAGRPVAAAREPARATSPTCGRTPASSCCSWAPSSARSPSGPSPASWTGGCSTTPSTVGVQKLIVDLNRIYKESPALYGLDHDPAGFQWIDGGDAGRNLFSWIRRAPGAEDLVCVTNFAAVPHHDVRLGLPQTGTWEEVAQHRRRALRRLRRRQPRCRRGGRGRVERPAGVRRHHRAAAGLRVVPAPRLTGLLLIGPELLVRQGLRADSVVRCRWSPAARHSACCGAGSLGAVAAVAAEWSGQPA